MRFPWTRRPIKRAILVLGAPRSGTSAVSHVLSEMGVNFGDPRRFVDPVVHKHNPIFFELTSLNELNDAIFAKFGTSFGAFDWMPTAAELSRVREFNKPIARLMAEEFGASPLVGLKDPRFCFTLPIWQRALTSLGYEISYVVTHRSPHAVLSSNQTLNGLSPEANFRLVALSDLLPRRFLINEADVTHVAYEGLIEFPADTCTTLACAIGLDSGSAETASAAIDPSLAHQREPPYHPGPQHSGG